MDGRVQAEERLLAAATPLTGPEAIPAAASRPDVAKRFWLVAAAGGLCLYTALVATGNGQSTVADVVYCGLFALVVVSCLARARRPAGGPWRLAAGGVALWGSAEVVYRLSTEPTSWYPRASQVLLFAGFLLAWSTLALLARIRIGRPDVLLGLDGVIAGLTAAAIAAAVAEPTLRSSTTMFHAQPDTFLLAALFPLVFVVVVLGLTGWRPGRAWALVTTGIVLNVIGDVVLTRMVASGTFHRGSAADVLFASSALLLGAAAFNPLEAGRRPVMGHRRLVVPVACALVAIGLLAASALGPVGGVSAGLASAALLATLLRMTVALEAVERSRRDALSDPLTGLGNRRRLLREFERWAAAADDEPFTVALFDLDGFKRYNDVFGHLSGDALLVLFADRLASAAYPGMAFRMGGDEFCVLVPCVDDAAEDVIARCRAALAERGEGFVVTTSAGSASVPRDCRDVRSALSAADTALYGEKARFRSTDERVATGALLQSVSERDPALGGHMRAVARLAILVARRLGLDEEQVAVVAAAAELHDVGKMAVPDAVLRKPGPLDGDEWRLVRRHTLAGERILRAAPGLQHVAPIVRACHERWDGSGYPDGLAGEAIPQPARIVAACDAYDAMRADRPHRPAMSAAAAVAQLRRGAGVEFDPAVVEAVIAEVRT